MSFQVESNFHMKYRKYRSNFQLPRPFHASFSGSGGLSPSTALRSLQQKPLVPTKKSCASECLPANLEDSPLARPKLPGLKGNSLSSKVVPVGFIKGLPETRETTKIYSSSSPASSKQNLFK